MQLQSAVLCCKHLTLGGNIYRFRPESLECHRVIRSVPSSPQQGEHSLDEHKLHTYLSALQSLIPPLFAVVLLNAPFTCRAKPHPDIPAIEGGTEQTRLHVRRQ